MRMLGEDQRWYLFSWKGRKKGKILQPLLREIIYSSRKAAFSSPLIFFDMQNWRSQLQNARKRQKRELVPELREENLADTAAHAPKYLFQIEPEIHCPIPTCQLGIG